MQNQQRNKKIENFIKALYSLKSRNTTNEIPHDVISTISLTEIIINNITIIF